MPRKKSKMGGKKPSKVSRASNAPALKKGKKQSSAPVSRQSIMTTQKPTMTSSMSSDGSIRVRHREFLANVLGSVNFTATQYGINPGLPVTVPWLSTLAQNYESYQFRRLAFEFETMKSTSTDGRISMAIDYDAADDPPTTKGDLMSYQGAVAGAVWQEVCCTGDSKDLRKFGTKRYIRTGPLGANLDIKTYDVGNLFIATDGCADASAIGELYVVYDIDLQTPQRSQNQGIGLVASASITASTGVTQTSTFGSAPMTILKNMSVVADSDTLTFNTPGTYFVSMETVGTVLDGDGPALSGTSSNQGIYFTQHTNTANTNGLVCVYCTAAAGQTLVVDWSAHLTTLTMTETIITMVDPSVV